MKPLPPFIRQELMLGLADRRRDVAGKLGAMALTPADAGLPADVGGCADAEECLRVLMVRLFPRFVRGRAHLSEVRDALRLLTYISAAAQSEDFRYLDAFNNFWEHWPFGLHEESDRRLAGTYRALLDRHLDDLKA